MRVPGGTAAVPGYGFIADSDTGVWRPAADQVGIVGGGVSHWEWRSGHYIPVLDNTYDIGDSTHSVRDIYLDGQVKGDGEFVEAVAFGGFADFTGTTTNPGGRTWSGYYVKHGKKLSLWLMVTLTSVGSGQYNFVVPNMNNTVIPNNTGVGVWQASLGGVLTGGTVRKQTNGNLRCTLSGAGGTFGSAQGMATGDTLSIMAEYITP